MGQAPTKRDTQFNAFKEYMSNAQISDMYGDKRLFVELYGRLLAEDDFKYARGGFKEVVLGTKELAFTCPNKNGGYECVYSVERVVIDKKDGGRKRAKQIANSKFKQWRKFKDLENQGALSNYILVADEMAINNWDKNAECWIVCKLQKCISLNEYDLTTVRQLATGLKRLYKKKVFFGDIKPDNIMFCDGRWKFIDVDDLIVGWQYTVDMPATEDYLPTGIREKEKEYADLWELYEKKDKTDNTQKIMRQKIMQEIVSMELELKIMEDTKPNLIKVVYEYSLKNPINFLECNVYALCVSLSEMLTDTFDDIEEIKKNIVEHVKSRKHRPRGRFEVEDLKDYEVILLGYLDTLIGLSSAMPLAKSFSLKF